MRRYRSRQNKVTHQGSAVPAADALLAPTSTTSADRVAVPTAAPSVPEHCHFATASVRASYASGHCAVGSSVIFVLLLTAQEVTHDHRS
jgi:hypothetical protein